MTAPVSASAPRRVAVPGGSGIPCTPESWADPEFGKTRLGARIVATLATLSDGPGTPT